MPDELDFSSELGLSRIESDHFTQEDENLDKSQTQKVNVEFLVNLFNDDIDNEETTFELVSRDDIPEMVLRESNVGDLRFDFLNGLINVFRRLMRIHDEALNQWLGMDTRADTCNISIIAFIFNIIEKYYEQLCFVEEVEVGELSISLYDNLCSTICSFLMTLSEEQLDSVEEILFENLFSLKFLRSFLAADLLCFLCRTNEASFSYQVSQLLFSILAQLYTEDVETKDFTSEAAYLNLNFAQELLLNLLNRILSYMEPSEVDHLQKDYPFEDYAFLWKRFIAIELDASTLRENNEKYTFDKLSLINKISPSAHLSIVDNFMQSTEEYYSLLCLRLLSDMTDYLNTYQLVDIFRKTTEMISDNSKYQKHLFFAILPMLNCLANFENADFQDERFINILEELFLSLYEASNSNYIMKQYTLVTLQNISANELLESILSLITERINLKREFKWHIKYYMQGRFMTREERELYAICSKKSYYESCSENIDYPTAFTEISISPFISNCLSNSTTLKRQSDLMDDYVDCKRIRSESSDDNNLREPMETLLEEETRHHIPSENKLVLELQSCLDLFGGIQSVTKEEKQTLCSLSEQLNTLIDKLNVDDFII